MIFTRSAHSRQILAGHPPFSELIEIAAKHAMVMGRRPPRPDRPEISDRLWRMIRQCWHIEPSQRMSIAEAVSLLETELRRSSDS